MDRPADTANPIPNMSAQNDTSQIAVEVYRKALERFKLSMGAKLEDLRLAVQESNEELAAAEAAYSAAYSDDDPETEGSSQSDAESNDSDDGRFSASDLAQEIEICADVLESLVTEARDALRKSMEAGDDLPTRRELALKLFLLLKQPAENLTVGSSVLLVVTQPFEERSRGITRVLDESNDFARYKDLGVLDSFGKEFEKLVEGCVGHIVRGAKALILFAMDPLVQSAFGLPFRGGQPAIANDPASTMVRFQSALLPQTMPPKSDPKRAEFDADTLTVFLSPAFDLWLTFATTTLNNLLVVDPDCARTAMFADLELLDALACLAFDYFILLDDILEGPAGRKRPQRRSEKEGILTRAMLVVGLLSGATVSNGPALKSHFTSASDSDRLAECRPVFAPRNRVCLVPAKLASNERTLMDFIFTLATRYMNRSADEGGANAIRFAARWPACFPRFRTPK